MEIALVLTILAGATLLFATERLSVDLVALLVLAVLLIFGLVSPTEGLAGFSSSATVTVGAMFVLSSGLQRTGAVSALGRGLVQLASHHRLLLVVTMATAGLASAVINNTPVVAVFMPLVLAVSERGRIAPSKLLIPLSFASQFGGVCTLIGTSTNLLVSAYSEHAGYGAFSMFEFGQLGLILFVAGVVYFLLFGQRLLPERRTQLTERYQLREYITELRVTPDSPLVGKTIRDNRLFQQRDVTVVEIVRENATLWAPLDEAIRGDDLLLVRGRVENLLSLREAARLRLEPTFEVRDEAFQTSDLSLVEAVIPPQSRLIGHTLGEIGFRRAFNSMVLGVQRRGQRPAEKLRLLRLRLGDALLLHTPRGEVPALLDSDDLIVLAHRDAAPRKDHRASLALLIIGAVVLASAAELVPILTAAIIGAVAMVLGRCLSLDEAYASIDWKVIFLLAGILPLGTALEKSGTAHYLADLAIGMVGGMGPLATLAAIYGLTVLLTSFISNNAAAVLLAPIAISTALELGVDPKPFLMAVTFAASTSFATPVGYQTNTMVYNPGGYRFMDFIKVGLPLNLIFWFLAVMFIPRFWPL